MPAPVITLEQWQRILEVKAMRAAIPTDAELAAELGLNISTMHNAMHGRPLKRLEYARRRAMNEARAQP